MILQSIDLRAQFSDIDLKKKKVKSWVCFPLNHNYELALVGHIKHKTNTQNLWIVMWKIMKNFKLCEQFCTALCMQ